MTTTTGNMRQPRTPRAFDLPRSAAVLLFVASAVAMALGGGGMVLYADGLREGISQGTISPAPEQQPKIAFLRLGIAAGTNAVRLIEARVVPGRLKPQVAARRTTGWLELEAVDADGDVLWRRWEPDPSLERYEYATPADGSGTAGGLAWTSPSPRGKGEGGAEDEYQCMVRIPWDARAATTLRVYRNPAVGGNEDNKRLQVASAAAVAAAAEGTPPEALRVLVGSLSLTNILNQATQQP